MSTSYNYSFVCNYKNIELTQLQKIEDTDEDLKDDVYFLCEEIYRREFLSCFHLLEYDDHVINTTVNALYTKCYQDPNFKIVLDFISEHMQEPDIEMCFMQLFSYHYLYLTHSCIRQLEHTKALDEPLRNQLLDAYKTINHLQ